MRKFTIGGLTRALVCLGAMHSLCLAQPHAAAPEPQLFGENLISTGDDESHPAFTPDGKTLYFLKNDPSFNHWTIVVSHEQNGKWSTPEVAPFSGQFSDADPFITLDGQRFFFISTRPVNGKAKEDTDIWMIEWRRIAADKAAQPVGQRRSMWPR